MAIKKRNECDGMIFQSKKDLEYYIHLKELKENDLIQSFSFDFFLDEKSNEMKYRSSKMEIDEKTFLSKSDADYYLYLTELKKKNVIQNFSLATTQKDSEEKTKYAAKKVEIDNHLFDSKTEADYYIFLLQQKSEERIEDFELQPTFELQPSFKKNGKNFRKIEYIADFEVFHLDGSVEVVDVKGMITPEFSIKQKMFEYRFPEKSLTLMKYVEKYGGWITMDDWKKRKREDKKKK